MNNQSNNTLFTGKVAIQLRSVDSTNKYAQELLTKSTPIEGTVIVADEQYAGRGQVGSSWLSAACQNIILSVLFHPKFLLAKQQFYLNAAISLGIYHFIQQFPIPKTVKIKWPNDIYVGNQKIAGILIENTLKGTYLDWSIVGIGINVNQETFSETLQNPSSIKLLTGQEWNLDNCLQALYTCLEQQYLRIKTGDLVQLRADYINKLFQLGEEKKYFLEQEKRAITGTIEGVDAYGRLMLAYENRLQAFDMKEIRPILR